MTSSASAATCAVTRSRSPTTSARVWSRLGELIRCDFSKYPNVNRWLGNVKKLKSWAKVNEVVYGFAGSLKDKPFVTI